METKEIEIKGVKYKLKELTYGEGIELGSVDKTQYSFHIISKCLVEPLLSPEQIKELPLKIANRLLRVVNELNGFNEADFFTEVQSKQSG